MDHFLLFFSRWGSDLPLLFFGVLSFFVRLAFPDLRVRITVIDFPILNPALVESIVIEEISQLFIASRTFSWCDLTASLAGC
jgi:hypothetical protein